MKKYIITLFLSLFIIGNVLAYVSEWDANKFVGKNIIVNYKGYEWIEQKRKVQTIIGKCLQVIEIDYIDYLIIIDCFKRIHTIKLQDVKNIEEYK